MKSTAIIPESKEYLTEFIADFDQKSQYDGTFEKGHYIIDLPMGVKIVYQKFKKILIVSARDMITVSH